jgi:hypothetical protein
LDYDAWRATWGYGTRGSVGRGGASLATYQSIGCASSLSNNGPRRDDPRLASPRKDPAEARAYFIRRASALGYRVADLQPLFLEHYKSHRRHFDYYPVDAHWNGLGHRLAAQRAYDFLFRQPDGHC